MPKKISHNDPMRPRNIIKRERRQQKEQHRKLMLQKRDAEKKDKATTKVTYAATPSQHQKAVPSAAEQSQTEQPKKVFHAEHVKEVKSYLQRLNKRIHLPFTVNTLRKGKVSQVLVINNDGKQRELLPDTPPCHKILCHGSVAHVIKSGMCVFAKITQHERIDPQTGRQWIDGSWTIAPCSPAMLNGTTVQHVRRRPWFLFRRYWYEISFDGRVQPASLFYDYDIDPTTQRQRLYITHEFIKVRNSNVENSYFRFWKNKPL